MEDFRFSVRFRWDTGLNFLAIQCLSDAVRVITLVCQQFFDAVNIFPDKFLSLLAIARVAWRKAEINRFLFYIGYHMYLCIPAPLVRPIWRGSPSDLRLQAVRCALAKVESIAAMLLFPSFFVRE